MPNLVTGPGRSARSLARQCDLEIAASGKSPVAYARAQAQKPAPLTRSADGSNHSGSVAGRTDIGIDAAGRRMLVDALRHPTIAIQERRRNDRPSAVVRSGNGGWVDVAIRARAVRARPIDGTILRGGWRAHRSCSKRGAESQNRKGQL